MLWQIPLPSFTPALPEIFLALSILALTLVGLFSGRHAFKVTYILSLIVIGITLALIVVQPNTPRITFSGLFISDAFSIYAKIFITSTVGLILVMVKSSLVQNELALFEYPILVLTSTLGMMLMVSANDLISVFMAIELLSLSLYILIALKRKSVEASEASLKYFILGALATGILLYGISWIYGFSGTTNFEILARFLHNHELQNIVFLVIGLTLILVGIAFKISAAPFHMWAPDVYHGTPIPIMVFLVSVPKFAAFMVVIRLLTDPFSTLMVHWSNVIMVLSISSMIIGAFAALTQQSIKRFIAYSSIGQVGFALIGIMLSNEMGYRATLMFLVFYLITIVGFMGGLVHLSRRGHAIHTLADLNGLGRHHPIISFCLGFFIFSLAGIPPLPGFLPKLMMIQSTIQHNYYGISIVAVLYSVIAAAYYLMLIKAIFIDKPARADSAAAMLKTHDNESLIVTYSLLILLLGLMIFPNPLLSWTSRVTTSLTFF